MPRQIDDFRLSPLMLSKLIERTNGEYLSIFNCDRLGKRLGIVDSYDVAALIDSIGNLAATRPLRKNCDDKQQPKSIHHSLQ